jgi:hypothetical protein
VAAAHREQLALRRADLGPDEQLCGLPIGEDGFKQRLTPARNALADASGTRVVDFGHVLRWVDLKVPLQIALRVVIERARERLCRRGLRLAVLVEGDNDVRRIVEPQAEFVGHHPSRQKASMPR